VKVSGAVLGTSKTDIMRLIHIVTSDLDFHLLSLTRVGRVLWPLPLGSLMQVPRCSSHAEVDRGFSLCVDIGHTSTKTADGPVTTCRKTRRPQSIQQTTSNNRSSDATFHAVGSASAWVNPGRRPVSGGLCRCTSFLLFNKSPISPECKDNCCK
jgi:hypothetical protein